MANIRNKIKIMKWEKSFIRDEWGNLKICFWNKMVKEEILKLDKDYGRSHKTIKVNLR